jgi:hypothetical protein
LGSWWECSGKISNRFAYATTLAPPPTQPKLLRQLSLRRQCSRHLRCNCKAIETLKPIGSCTTQKKTQFEYALLPAHEKAPLGSRGGADKQQKDSANRFVKTFVSYPAEWPVGANYGQFYWSAAYWQMMGEFHRLYSRIDNCVKPIYSFPKWQIKWLGKSMLQNYVVQFLVGASPFFRSKNCSNQHWIATIKHAINYVWASPKISRAA